MAGTVDWQRLTDGQCWEALRAAPPVYGPWTRAGDDENAYIRPKPDGSPSFVLVKRIMGSWYGYIGNSVSLPSAFATCEPAMDMVDKRLRLKGARLVGASRPNRQEIVREETVDDDERPTIPAAPRHPTLLAVGDR